MNKDKKICIDLRNLFIDKADIKKDIKNNYITNITGIEKLEPKYKEWKIYKKGSRYVEDIFLVSNKVEYEVTEKGKKILYDIFFDLSYIYKLSMYLFANNEIENINKEEMVRLLSLYGESLSMLNEDNKYELFSNFKKEELTNNIKDYNKTQVLIDSGSPVNIMSLRKAREVKARTINKSIDVVGLGAADVEDIDTYPLAIISTVIMNPDEKKDSKIISFNQLYVIIPDFETFLGYDVLVGEMFIEKLKENNVKSEL
ncbi:MAG: hypothetical protein GF317_05970 [Candidatus Lokiarchaeota archaeon]|nr:hypothetical protein [Candidatus Lokiarchaeota archaeon]